MLAQHRDVYRPNTTLQCVGDVTMLAIPTGIAVGTFDNTSIGRLFKQHNGLLFFFVKTLGQYTGKVIRTQINISCQHIFIYIYLYMESNHVIIRTMYSQPA